MNVSVLIPSYNRAHVIGKTLVSIAEQTMLPNEIVIIDDGSSDDTASVVSEVSNRYPTINFVYNRQENQGKCVALNNGIKLCRGDYIAFNDSDDEWHPDKLKLQFEILARPAGLQACFTNAQYTTDGISRDERGVLDGRADLDSKRSGIWDQSLLNLARNPYGIFMQTIVVSRVIAEKVFPLNPAFKVAQDIDLIFRIAVYTDYLYIGQKLVNIDRSETVGDRLTKDHDMKSLYRLQIFETMVEEWLALPSPKVATARGALRKRLADYRKMIATRHHKDGEKLEANRYARKALKANLSVKQLLWYASFKANLIK